MHKIQSTPSNPYHRWAKKSLGSVLSCMALTNLRAVSGGSPLPVVETTTTRGALSVFRSYYKIRVSCQRAIAACVFDLTHQQSNQVNFPSCCLERIMAERYTEHFKVGKESVTLQKSGNLAVRKGPTPSGFQRAENTVSGKLRSSVFPSLTNQVSLF